MRAPDYIANAARERVRTATAQREKVAAAVQAGRPLEAEPDLARRVLRMQAVAGVTRDAAEALAGGMDPNRFGLAGEAKLGAERIQGRTTDFVGVSFLDLARTAASTVARVVYKDLRAEGSGFLIAPGVFMTNNHVIPDLAAAREFLVEFNHELDVDGRPRAETRFALDPARLFFTNAEEEYDFTLVALGALVSGAGDPSSFGYCPLIATDDKHTLGEYVNIIEHPDGDYKQLVLRENRLVSRFDTVLHYMADTNPGSSGSPVFNDQWEVIALHHWGEPYREVRTPDGQPVQKDVNEGIRISAIVGALQDHLPQFDPEAQRLIEAALKVPTRRPVPGEAARPAAPSAPRATKEPMKLTNGTKAPTGRVLQEARMGSPTGPRMNADGSVTWTVPVTIAVQVGGMSQKTADEPSGMGRADHEPTVDGDALGRSTAGGLGGPEAARPDPDYSNRPGYKSNFLPHFEVPLPVLSPALQAKAVRKIRVGAHEDPFQLDYQHFSIVMNADRRMAFFAGSNIDGSTWKDINRKTGAINEESLSGAEGGETWYQDPRIRRDEQTQQTLYDGQHPRTFDRGHLVRRQDPAWGTPARAKKANDDTFHFTNCTPQEWRFNEQTAHWQGIEQWVLEHGAVADRERVCVLTGPVLSDDDPPYRDVLVPQAFWKVVVFVRDGELHATALLADQSRMLGQFPERMRRRAEHLEDPEEVKSYQITIRDLERQTGLDFGELREHDTLQGGGEAAAGGRRLIRSFSDISLDLPAHV